MRSLAVFLSYLLHPVFMLTYVMSFFIFTENYFSYFMTPAKKIFLLVAVFIFSVALPLLNVALLKRLGYIKSFYMKESAERFMPYVSSIVLHSGLFYIIHDLDIPFFFKYLVITSVSVLVVLFIVNIFTKISAHVTSLAGCFGILVFYEFISFAPVLLPLCVCLFICGLAGFARLYLQVHTPKQVYLGFVTGLASSVLCLILLLYINYHF
jgi:hypothetical protein